MPVERSLRHSGVFTVSQCAQDALRLPPPPAAGFCGPLWAPLSGLFWFRLPGEARCGEGRLRCCRRGASYDSSLQGNEITTNQHSS